MASCEYGIKGWARNSWSVTGTKIMNDNPDTSSTLTVKLYYKAGAGAEQLLATIVSDDTDASVGNHAFAHYDLTALNPGIEAGTTYTIIAKAVN